MCYETVFPLEVGTRRILGRGSHGFRGGGGAAAAAAAAGGGKSSPTEYKEGAIEIDRKSSEPPPYTGDK